MSSITHTYTTSSPKGDGCGHEHRSIEEAGACLGRFVLEGGKGRQVLRRSAADRRRVQQLSDIRRVPGWYAGVHVWRGAALPTREEWERARSAALMIEKERRAARK